MKMSKVGNQTNSQDPQAVNSRVFVGNLNTFQCSKTDVERMFQRYGRLAGISMHKGYAFVQFTNPFDARNACVGEDGRTVLGQVLDVNMVAEPKPHQTGRKRQNLTLTDNDWDYYYDSYYASTVGFSGSPSLAAHISIPPTVGKRQRLSSVSGRVTKNGHHNTNGIKTNGTTNHVNNNLQISDTPLKVYSNPDILICGNCREMFTDLKEIINHKKTYCKLRFTCRCHNMDPVDKVTNGHDSTSLLCSHCKEAFLNAWDLMVHIQATHMVNIYEMGTRYTEDKEDSSGRSSSSSPTVHHNQKSSCEEHLAGMVVTNGKHNGTCKQNGDSSYNNGVEDTPIIENKNGSPHSSSSEVEQMDNDEDMPMPSNSLSANAIIADSQTLASVLLINTAN